MLVVPNEWTDAQTRANEVAAKKFWWLDATHYSYFSWGSLERLLAKHGFRIVSRMGTFQMEDFIIQGIDYTGKPEVGRDAHRRIEALELSMSADQLRAAYRGLGKRGAGRDIVAFCKRPDEA